MNINYGYVRVSTKQQNIDRQVFALEEIGIKKEYIYTDKMTGVVFDRPEYLKLKKKMKPGDTLFIKSIDRLGRKYSEIIEQWNHLVNTQKVNIVVLDFPLLDTREKDNNLTGKFLSDIILQILSYISQVEKENTYQRQMEGIKAAKRKGVKFGRPKVKITNEFMDVYALWKKKEISQRKAGQLLGITHHTFRRMADELQETS